MFIKNIRPCKNVTVRGIQEKQAQCLMEMMVSVAVSFLSVQRQNKCFACFRCILLDYQCPLTISHLCMFSVGVPRL